MDERNTSTMTPDERRLITKLYGPDPREDGHPPSDRKVEETAFVFDIEDMALVGRPVEGRRWPHQ